jgi:hypothetical protein
MFTTSIQQNVVGYYEIHGNQYVAIAVHIKDPSDAHYFTIDPDVNNNAYIRACNFAAQLIDEQLIAAQQALVPFQK